MTQSNRILQQNALLARMARGDDINSGENSADDLDNEWENALSSLQIDIRTQFAPLFETGNEKYLELFRHSYSGGMPESSEGGASRRRARRDEWRAAEATWINRVEKRLRSVCEKCVCERSDLKILEFLQALEAILLLFAESGTAPDRILPPGPFASMLVRPLMVEDVSEEVYRTRPRAGSRTNKGTLKLTLEETHIPSLRIFMRDSSLHRLVLHATAQFYGLRSISESQNSSITSLGEDDGVTSAFSPIEGRISRVALPRTVNSKKNPMLVEKVSLAAYLEAAVEVIKEK